MDGGPSVVSQSVSPSPSQSVIMLAPNPPGAPLGATGVAIDRKNPNVPRTPPRSVLNKWGMSGGFRGLARKRTSPPVSGLEVVAQRGEGRQPSPRPLSLSSRRSRAARRRRRRRHKVETSTTASHGEPRRHGILAGCCRFW